MSNINLSGVKPAPGSQVTSSTPAIKPKTKTQKQEAQQRHQTVVRKDDSSNLHMGLGTVSAEIIEQQILKGLGQWAPENTTQIPLTILKEDAERLVKALGSKPSSPTPHSILGKDTCTPFSIYKENGGTSEYGSLNAIDLTSTTTAIDFNSEASKIDREPVVIKDKEYALNHSHTAAQNKQTTSIANFASSVVRNIVEKNLYHEDRTTAYVQYLQWLTTALEDSVVIGQKYNKDSVEWTKDKELSDAATGLYRAQLAYENSLTDSQKRAIQQEERIKQLEAQLLKPKRTRRTKAEMNADV